MLHIVFDWNFAIIYLSLLLRLRIGLATTWPEGLVRIARVECKQNNVQVVDMHIRLTANGVLKDFADGKDSVTNLSCSEGRKQEAIELG
jgi:hypothetical protein